jgi:hypothetical protein
MKGNLRIKKDNEIKTYFNQLRSNSCTINDKILVYPFDFAPSIRPRAGNVVPSPICLGPKHHGELEDIDYLYLSSDSR